MDKKTTILVALVVLLVVLFIVNARDGGPKRIAKLTFETGKAAQLKVEAPPELPQLKRDLLAREREAFRMGGKGIFEPLKFKRKKPPPPPPPPPKPEPVPEPPKETEMEKAVATFTFVGFLEAEKIKTIFLKRRDEIFVVREGDTILAQYVVKRITDNQIVISSRDESEVLEISLIENQPLKNE